MHQVWDALVLGFMELQGGDASQHSAEKGGKPQFWGKQFFFLYPSNPFSPLPLPKSHWVLQSIFPFFQEGGAGGAGSTESLSQPNYSPIIQSIIYFGNTGKMGKSIQTPG